MPYGESNMAFSGKFEYGMDASGAPNSKKLKTTRLVGSIESDKHFNSRLKGLGPVRGRRRYVKTVSMLIVMCAAAIVVVSGLALTDASQATVSASARAPGPPHPVYGWTFDADGVTPMTDCEMTFRVVRTGEIITYTEELGANAYVIDMSMFQEGYDAVTWLDILNVTAVKGSQIGWNETAITDNPDGNNQMNVTLNGTAIPEFSTVILPVGGLIALFAVVSLRRKGKEQ